MIEKLKKFLNNYSREINKQSRQEYEKSLRDLWKRNAELAIKIYGILNVRYISLHRVEDIPEQYREYYKDRANCVFDNMETLISYEHFTTERPGDIVADRDYSLDVLKSILSENYKPPKEIEDTLKHLLTLHFLYNHLLPTIPGLSHAIPLRAGYALALLVSSASNKSFVADDKGRTGSSTEAVQARKKEMGDLVVVVFDEAKKKSGRSPTVDSVRNKINTAFNVLHEKGELKELPEHLKNLIKHEGLIKKLFNEWPYKNEETGVPQVSTDTVGRRLKDNKTAPLV